MTKKLSPKTRQLFEAMLSGDKRALARLMTYVDNRHEDLLALMSEVYGSERQAVKIGVTGPPGAGKSTLVNRLIHHYRKAGKKVGVVAIDPSSPFTGGAVLGDRIRMVEHGADEDVFIRSLGSRGSHGGLSRATRDVVHLMQAFGFDVVFIETVGVGQTELDIMAVADLTLVVLVPESGDTIQTMKAGLMEIADVFAVNKCDREGADRIFVELRSLAEMSVHEKEIPVLKVSAAKNKGVEDLVDTMNRKLAQGVVHTDATGLLREECLDILLGELRHDLAQGLCEDGRYSAAFQRLVEEHHNPYQTAAEVLEELHKRRKP